jgi:hypothetical protein
MCDLDLCLHARPCLTMVIPLCMKRFCSGQAFLMTSKCDFDRLPRDLVHAHDIASYSSEHVYEVSLESLHMCRRYALDKISIFIHL